MSQAAREPQAGASRAQTSQQAPGASRPEAPPAGTPESGQKEKQAHAADLLPSVSVPTGGGAIRSLDEKFSVDAATGTAGMTVKLPFSPGRSGFTPAVQLAYDSGSGNGPLGFGWSLGIPAITRKTNKGLPQYSDGEESDVFIIAGAEDLVPVLDPAGGRKALTKTVYGTPFQVTFYRPRIEGLFSRIERWTAADTGITHWRTLSRDNVTVLYGADPASTVADPDNPAKIFSWHICRSWDDKGNAAVYSYTAEDSAGIDQAAAHEANRTPQTRATQIYLKTIQYGNIQPYFPDWTAQQETALPADWMFSVVLDYGDHTSTPPAPQADQPWALRPDPFSTYRGSFEVRTYRRIQRLLFFNNFPAEPTAGPDCLTRSLDLVYSDQQTPPDPHSPIYTFLVSVTQTGYRQGDQGLTTRSMPPLEFTYSQPQIQQEILTLDPDSMGNLPEGLDGSRFRWADLDGEGLSGILSDAGGGWYFKRNLSANNLIPQPGGTLAARACFGPLETVAGLPSRSDLYRMRLLDLSGSGRLDVVDLADPDPGFFERTQNGSFEPLQRFAALPLLDWSDPNVKFIDLTGDGLADILMTEDGLFTVHASLVGDAGFDTARLVRPGWDEEKGPSVVLADGTETIFTADMSGDGLSDIVRVRNGEASYWPNTGYGRFGSKVTMDLAPRFDNEERFDPRRIQLADIDGSGTADLLYIGEDGVTAWFNQSGNAWSAPASIAAFPTTDRLSTVQAIDLLGTGTACLVWSSPLPGETAAPLVYVDLMGGQKPHLMTCARNNLGAETRVTYAPSTRFYVADEQAGTPWVTRLPFPVQVAERIETIDWIGRNRLVTRYAYHHGYFDSYEREFRGFGMVEQWDTEELRADTAFGDSDFVNWNQQSWSPPVLTRTWFHTGAFENTQAVTQQYVSEYWTEPALRAPGRAADAAAMRPPDTVLPDGLNAFEIQEACRALKGHPLRIETYAEDGSPAAANPYTVTEHNFTVRCLQNMGENLHAVFFVHPREALSFHYERGPDDPRVGHEIILQADDYGNVQRSISIGYPRRAGYQPPEPTLSAATQAMLAYDQTRLHVMGTERGYTNAIDDLRKWPDAYRAPIPSAIDTAEITGAAPSVRGTGIISVFTFDEIDGTRGIWPTVWTGTHDLPYEDIPASDIDGTGSPASAATRRLTAQRRTIYRSDDLAALLAPGLLQPRALAGESYQAALTPGLLSAIFGTLVPVATLTEGGYVQLPGETGSWMPSGRVFYSPGDSDTPAQELATAIGQFFLPRRAVDPFGAISRADYDGYALLPVTVTDPVGNSTTASNDYRVLMPATVTDPNGNRVSGACDALGHVTATALMGKTTETVGDLLTGFTADLDNATLLAQFSDPLSDPAPILGNATTRTLYDLGAYQRTAAAAQPSPPAVYTLARETHISDLARGQATRYQHAFAYSDGFARVIQRKAQAAPGPLTDGGPVISPRWAGSGWTIFNNKGKPVRKYEPFLTATSSFEFAATTGVSSVFFYDPPGRQVAVLHPDSTWQKAVFDPWLQESWDSGDTVLVADPRADPDVGDQFIRLLGTAPGSFTSWHDQRIAGTYGATPYDRAAQQDAAQKAAAYAATPSAAHFDSLGRVCLTVGGNGGGQRYPSRIALDTEGKPLAVFDALARRAEEHCLRAQQASGARQYVAGTDMAGNPLYHNGMDGGPRRGLVNVAGKPIRNWDARGHAFRTRYDPSLRPTHRYVSTGGAPEILLDRFVYGEGQTAASLCGRLFRHYDTAGAVLTDLYDYKGNLLSSARQLTADYHQSPDWSALADLADPAALDAAAAPLLAPGDRFDASAAFDALNRPIQSVTPHSATMKPNVTRPSFDEGGLVDRVDAWRQQPAAPSGLLDPATADLHPVTAISYNARGQRTQAATGNGTVTSYAYDPATFRLTRLTTTRPNPTADQRVVQDLAYYYDPVGNITRIHDTADIQDVIFFANQRVEPSSDYTYDPLYRLTRASGREHLGQNSSGALLPPTQVTNDDSFRTSLLQPGDGNAMGSYTETYAYDPADNITTMTHQVSSGSWTRHYTYNELSQIDPAEGSNRLSTTSLPGDPPAGPYHASYAYDAHGNMLQMPHLRPITWDEQDRIASTTRHVVGGTAAPTTYYCYDSTAQRVRKTTDSQPAPGQQPTRQKERVYLGAVEIYREYDTNATAPTLVRETLHVDAATGTVCLDETRTTGTDPGAAELTRYQHTNHLGSAVLELDAKAQIISYEEYFPYGSTSYQAVRSKTETPKRYRYTGKERDEENDLYYHGARYYLPWLSRWASTDPAGLRDGVNQYCYARGNPLRHTDPTGLQSHDPQAPLTRIDRTGLAAGEAQDSPSLPALNATAGDTSGAETEKQEGATPDTEAPSGARQGWNWESAKEKAAAAWSSVKSAGSSAWRWVQEHASFSRKDELKTGPVTLKTDPSGTTEFKGEVGLGPASVSGSVDSKGKLELAIDVIKAKLKIGQAEVEGKAGTSASFTALGSPDDPYAAGTGSASVYVKGKASVDLPDLEGQAKVGTHEVKAEWSTEVYNILFSSGKDTSNAIRANYKVKSDFVAAQLGGEPEPMTYHELMMKGQ
jgi:RHS repeat-associated protein